MTAPDFIIPFERLPKRFAESVAHPPAAPAVPRPAATVILLREGEGGMEVLLMRRTRTAGFVPGAYVFPGGRVDAADADASLLGRVDGLSPQEAERRLELIAAHPPAVAYYVAALREAFEETGILVGRTAAGLVPATAAEDSAVDAVREELMDDRLSFAEALDRMACRLDGGGVQYIGHWITPVVEARRYDTRFFAAEVPSDARAVVDPREMTDAVWITPAAALSRQEEGTLPMVFPTIRTLEQLSLHRRPGDALAALGRSPVPTVMPRLVVTPTGIGMELDP
jgi:8-oxo-dGTP pyrophosphatase MutT (NUDIX family)